MYLKIATVSVFGGRERVNVSLTDFLWFEENLELGSLSLQR